jgi:uncharacterized repeat protein (TIGR01451 family)
MLAGGTVMGTVFTDAVGDGTHSAPQQNVDVDLYLDNGDKVFNPATDTLVDSPQVTDANGNYTFSNLADGLYYVTEVVPTGYTLTSTPAVYPLEVLNGVTYSDPTNIDNFNDPNPVNAGSTYAITGPTASNPNPTLITQTGTGIVGGVRNLAVDVLGNPNPISAEGFVGTANGQGVFNFGTASSGPGSEGILQYSAAAETLTGPGNTLPLSNQQGLNVDLTAGGANALRADFEYLQLAGGPLATIDVEVNLTSTGGGTATISTTAQQNGSAFTVNTAFSNFTTNGTFSFQHVTSVQYVFNSAGASDVDFELNQIVTSPLPNVDRPTRFDFANFATTAQLSITKVDNAGGSSITPSTGNVTPGQPLTYTIVASNAGPATLTGASVTDPFPANFTGASYTTVLAGGATDSNPTGTGNISDTVSLPVGASITYVVTGTVSSAATGTLTNTASITPTGGTPTSATDTDNIAQLSITKVDNAGGSSITPSTGNVTPGQSLTYTVVVHNSGTGSVTGASVTDPLPANFTSGTYTTVLAGGATDTKPTGSGNIADTVTLPAGATITYTVVGTVSSAATGSLTNTATVTPTAGTPMSATDNDNIAQLSITKVDNAGGSSIVPSTGNVTPGQSLTYTVVVHNSGTGSVTGASVTDPLPANFTSGTYTTVLAGGATDTKPTGSGNIADTVTLPAGATITYTVVGTISSAATGTLTNTATVTPTVGTPMSATDNDNIAQLSITKVDNAGGSSIVPSTGNVTPGQSLTYTVVVHNSGTGSVTGASVTDPLPANFTSGTYTTVLAGGATDSNPTGSGNISDTVTLPAGATITYTVVGTISSAATGTLTNTATVTPTAGTPMSATDNDNIAQLSITKVDNAGGSSIVPSTGNVTPGQSLTYTVVVHNSGTGSVTGASVTDPLPANFTSGTYTTVLAGGATDTKPTGSGNISDTVTLPAGATITYTVVGTVSSTATGSLTNTATVTPTAGTPMSATDVDNIAQLSITKVDNAGGSSITPSTGNVTPGQSLTYTVVVHNSGTGSVTGASVTDPLPANFTSGTYTTVLAGGATDTKPTGSGNISDTVTLPAGATITYTVVGTVSSAATGTLTNTATVTPTAGTPMSATDNDNIALLSITKVDNAGGSSIVPSTGSVVPGQSLTYTVVVHNTGTGSVTGASVTDPLPANFTGGTYTTVLAGGATDSNPTGSGNITDTVTLPAGATITYTVIGTVSAAATGTLTNVATVTPTAGTPMSATDVDNIAPLTITKVDSAGGSSITHQTGNAVPGQSLTYTVVVHNLGTGTVTGASVTDPLPANFTNGTYTTVLAGGATDSNPTGSGNITDTVTLPAGATITYTVIGTVSSTATGTLVNTATVTPPSGTPTMATVTDNLAHLTIVKTASQTTSVTPGQSLTYTVVVSNTGTGSVTGATITDPVPTNFTNVTYTASSSTGVTGFTASGSGSIDDTDVDFPAGSSVTYVIMGTVSATASGNLINTATVNSILGPSQSSTATNVVTTANSGSLTGFVYVDANNNGVFDTGEAPIGGVTITLTGTDNSGNSVTQTATTNSNGAYGFENLAPGTYTITETQPINFIDGKDSIGTQGGNATVQNVFSSVPVVNGIEGVNNNFGELGLTPPYVSKRDYLYPAEPVVLTAVNTTTGTAALSGYVFSEATAGSAAFNPTTPPTGESALADVTVALKNSGGTTVAQAVTNTSGFYSFVNIAPGTYSLSETANTGNTNDTAIVGSQGGTAGVGVISAITVVAGTNGTMNDFPEFTAATNTNTNTNTNVNAAVLAAAVQSPAVAANAAPSVAVASNSPAPSSTLSSPSSLDPSAVDAAFADENDAVSSRLLLSSLA